MSDDIVTSEEAADLYFSLIEQRQTKPQISDGKWEVCFCCQAVTHHSISEQQNHKLNRVTHYICDTCGIGGFYS